MKTKSATPEAQPHTPKMPEDFERFAKALMAVPKKELDKELVKHEHKTRGLKGRKQKS